MQRKKKLTAVSVSVLLCLNCLAIEKTKDIREKTGSFSFLLPKSRNYNITDLKSSDSGKRLLSTDIEMLNEKLARKESEWAGLCGKGIVKEKIKGGRCYKVSTKDRNMKYEKDIELYDNRKCIKLKHKITNISDTLKEEDVRWSDNLIIEFDPSLDAYSTGIGRGVVKGNIADNSDKSFRRIKNWICAYNKKSGKGVIVIFPERRGIQARLEGNTLTFKDSLWWRYSSDFKKGAVIGQECWIYPYSGGNPQTLADKYIKEILHNEPELSSYLFPYKYRNFPDSGLLLGKNSYLSLWTELPGKLVYMDTPPPEKSAENIDLRAAKNEYESFQLVITPGKNLKKVSVEVSGLKSRNGSIPKENIKLWHVGYLDIRRAKTEDYEKADPAVRRHARKKISFSGKIPKEDEIEKSDIFAAEVMDKENSGMLYDVFWGMEPGDIGPVPDILMPAKSLNMKAGRNYPVYITVKVPADCKPGNYSGQVTVKEAGKVIAKTALKLKVWNFTLPDSCSLKTNYQIWGPVKPARHSMFLENIARHKVSEGRIPHKNLPRMKIKDGNLEVDFRKFDEFMKYADSIGLGCFKLPYAQIGGGHRKLKDFVGFKPGTPEHEKYYREYLRLLKKHLQEKGWTGKFRCYIFDEPAPELMETVRKYAKIIHEENPGIKIYTTNRRLNEVEDFSDIFCPNLNYYDNPNNLYNVIDGKRPEDKEFWWYNQKYDGLGFQPVTLRTAFWLAYKYGIKGYFIWAVHRAPFTYPRNPLGSAYYIYSARDGSPIGSIRWETVRDGAEDYDLFIILEKSVKEAEKSGKTQLAEQGREVLKEVKDFIRDSGSLESDPVELEKLRIKAAEIIEKIKGKKK